MPGGLVHGIIVVALLFNEKRTALWTTASLKQTNNQEKKQQQQQQQQKKNTRKTLHSLNKQIKPYLHKIFEGLSMLKGFCLVIFLSKRERVK